MRCGWLGRSPAELNGLLASHGRRRLSPEKKTKAETPVSEQATTIIPRLLPTFKAQVSFRAETEADTEALKELSFESTSLGIAGPGLAEPSRMSSKSEAPSDAWDPKAL